MGDNQGQEGYKNLTQKGKENYLKVLEYLSDPENDWPRRRHYSTTILGYKRSRQLYRTLPPAILTEIETKAFRNRETRSTRQRSIIRNAMFKRAKGYSHEAVKILKQKVKTINPDGSITESEEPLYVPYLKHYPPDRAAAQEWEDRVYGKVPDKLDANITQRKIVIRRRTRDGDDES